MISLHPFYSGHRARCQLSGLVKESSTRSMLQFERDGDLYELPWPGLLEAFHCFCELVVFVNC